jgi:hypothetical protein
MFTHAIYSDLLRRAFRENSPGLRAKESRLPAAASPLKAGRSLQTRLRLRPWESAELSKTKMSTIINDPNEDSLLCPKLL